VISRDNNTASVELSNFYCNWMVIGNAITNADFSIETISLEERTFTGFYKLTFYGTGNVTGSGYYKPCSSQRKTEVATYISKANRSSIGPTRLRAVVVGRRRLSLHFLNRGGSNVRQVHCAYCCAQSV